jgi:hypothetical protein
VAVPKPDWNEKPPESDAAFEVEALAAAPVVVVLAFTALNTGCRLSAWALEFVWLVEAEDATVVPGPACTEKVPEAAALAAVAVVAVAARAGAAAKSAKAAAAAKSRFFMLVS